MTALLTKDEAQELLDGEVAEESWGDVTVADIELDGSSIDANILAIVTAADIERTIEGASTLTIAVWDRERVLIESKIFAQKTVLTKINGNLFELVKVEKSGAQLTLTFEDYIVALLRKHKRFIKTSRSKATRAEFILRIIREVKAYKIHTFIPELHAKQKITKAVKSKGLSGSSHLKVKGKAISKRQLRQAEVALGVAHDLRATTRVMVAMICAAIGESTLGADMGPNSLGYAGVFQANVRAIAKNDTKKQAHYFLKGGKGFQAGGAIVLAKTSQSIGPGEIATRVEASGEAPSFYGQYKGEAEAIVKAYGGGGSDGSTSRVKTYEFTRGQPKKEEDSWTCIRRLADEVAWQSFVVNNTFYYISEKELYAQDPSAIISEDLDFVDSIDFDWDLGKKAAEATVNCRASLWSCPPGSVVVLEHCGPADGRWLVVSVSRSLFGLNASIALRQPMTKRAEPAAETVSTGGSGKGGASTSGFGNPLKSMPAVSGKFGEQRPGHLHAGTDLPVAIGTPVYAVADGKVTHSGVEGGYGNSVVIQHTAVSSRYGHLSRMKVQVGQRVRKGDLIAYSGNTGHSTGPHLHFEIIKGGHQVCPANYVKGIPASACVRQSI